jgi:predicted TIM-barrel fold metal-dependent hydrolase
VTSGTARLVLLLLAAMASGAPAHPLAPSLLELRELDPDHVEVVWKTPLMRAPGEVLEAALPSRCRPLGRPASAREDTGLRVRWVATCGPEGLAGERVGVRGLESSMAGVLVRVTLLDGRIVESFLSPGRSSLAIPARPDRQDVATGYLRRGGAYLLSAPDHLLFVFGLVLLAGSMRRLTGTVATFMLGHSVTLTLATLGVLEVAPQPLGMVVALSVLLLAVELARDATAPTLVRRHPWATAGAVGLLHGLAFAAALREAGLPEAETPLALLSFNVGIEAALLLFVLGVLALWRALSPVLERLPAWTRRVPAYVSERGTPAAATRRATLDWGGASGVGPAMAADRAARLRARLGHPVIDADGHTIEFLPAVRDELRALAGGRAVEQLDLVLDFARVTRALGPTERRLLGLPRLPWWGLPTRNTRDRATAMLPRLLYERLDEIGIDFAVLYPTYGLFALAVPEPEVRQAACRAVNRYHAAVFRELGDRLTPAAVIPMHTPAEAVAELDHAIGTLGLRAAVLAGHVMRPLPFAGAPRGAHWVDTFGPDSPHGYDPVWERCQQLGVAPTFHSSSMSWDGRGWLTNYVANHVGTFAAAGEASCRSLFLSGVPRRFPALRFAFLEGGVGWACDLYAGLVGHWEKRNREHLEHYNPARLDRPLLTELFRRWGAPEMVARLGRLDEGLTCLSEPDEDPATLDEFAAAGIRAAEDIRQVFAERFHFGCEADDARAAAAFDTRVNPLGARLRAIFSSDIGHWDVPDMGDVLPDAHRLVESGLLGEDEFRDFVFANAVALWTGPNPRFFAGTVVESAVAALTA